MQKKGHQDDTDNISKIRVKLEHLRWSQISEETIQKKIKFLGDKITVILFPKSFEGDVEIHESRLKFHIRFLSSFMMTENMKRN